MIRGEADAMSPRATTIKNRTTPACAQVRTAARMTVSARMNALTMLKLPRSMVCILPSGFDEMCDFRRRHSGLPGEADHLGGFLFELAQIRPGDDGRAAVGHARAHAAFEHEHAVGL